MKLFFLLLGLLAVAAATETDLKQTGDQEKSSASVEEEVQTSNDPISVSIGKTDEPDAENGEPFIATNEWQEIKPGQTIPRGLHVRMNLQTGLKEAKILEKDEQATKTEKPDSDGLVLVENEQDENQDGTDEAAETSRMKLMKKAIEDAMADLEKEQKDDLQYWKAGKKEGMVNLNKKTFSRDELKEALKKFKANRDDVKDENIDKKSEYRDIDTLKKEFEELNLNMKTDYEIIVALYKKYKEGNLDIEYHKNILTDLEFYLHQIDNAKDFSKMGGLSLVIKDLNHTEESIRSEAAFVLGSATQSNPQVQIQAIEDGALHQLIRMIASQNSLSVKNRVIYAISSLVRHFPYAQQKFIQLGGFSALSDLFHTQGTEKLRLKCITLITDLILEQKHSVDSNSDEQKVAQYKQLPLIKSLTEGGWCELVPTMLSSEEHDGREKVLTAMNSLMTHCRSSFLKSISELNKLKTEYETLSKTELVENDEDQYYTGLLSTVVNLVTHLKAKEEL